ncbi:MAG: hypothetical protein WA231_17315, partial [Methylocella sp.]
DFRRWVIVCRHRMSAALLSRVYPFKIGKGPALSGNKQRFGRVRLAQNHLFRGDHRADPRHDRESASYNEERPHQGRWCFGKTPLQTFLDAIPIAREK